MAYYVMVLKLLLITLLCITSIMSLAYALYGYMKREDTTGALAFTGFMLTAGLYAAGYAWELYTGTMEGVTWGLRIEYLGISFLPAFLLLLALQFTGRITGITWRWALILFTLPVITLVLHYTNNLHGLYYAKLEIDSSGAFPLAIITKGPWYYVHSVYLNLSFAMANVLFFHKYFSTNGLFRKQALAMFFISLLPWTTYLVYLAGLGPRGIDLNPFSIALTGPFVAVALFRFRLLDVKPIAHETIMAMLADPVLVFDNAKRLVAMNTAAPVAIPELTLAETGSLLPDMLPSDHPLMSFINADDIGSMHGNPEIQLDTRHGARSFTVSMSMVKGKNMAQLASIILLHDITEYRAMQDRLLSQKDLLEEKTRAIEKLNQGLRDEVNDAINNIREKEELITLQGRYMAMGEIMDFVAHQWKQHIYAVSLQLSAVKNTVTRGKDIPVSSLAAMENHLTIMNQTLVDFRQFLSIEEKNSSMFSVSEVVQSTLDLTKDLLMVSSISITTSYQGDSKVTGRKNELAQVMLNLIDNARKIFIQRKIEQPSLLITVQELGDQVVISITDNGGGIQPKHEKSLFQKFFSTTSGAGLGLYLSRIIIEQHFHGTITAESRDGSATFRVILPGSGNPSPVED